MKTFFVLLFLSLSLSGASASEREIFGKLIIKVDKKKFSYYRPGSFTDKFVIRPDQSLIVSRSKPKVSVVLTQMDDLQDKNFETFCAESFKQMQQIQKSDQKSKLKQIDKNNCQLITEQKKDSTLQWLHQYTFKKKNYILSLSMTQINAQISASTSFIENFLKGNTYELR